MPIETICKGCSRKLRVGDEHAGKKARCPQCGTLYTVPGSAAGSIDQTTAGPTSSPITEARPQGWRLRTPDGRVYGPVPKDELDQWMQEGRVTLNCQVNHPDTGLWMTADSVYPQLGVKQSGPANQAGPTRQNPFSDSATDQANPFAATTSQLSSYTQPHRGGLILTLSILGWAICLIFAPFAWAMGSADIKAMRAGQMDPSGMGLTQAGMILGMVQCILMLIGVAIWLLLIVGLGVANM